MPLLIFLAGALLDALAVIEVFSQLGPEAELHLPQRYVIQPLAVMPGVPVAKLIQVAAVILVASLWRRWTGRLMAICGLLYTLAAMSNHFRWL